MAENAARVAWAGAGLMLPWRLLGAAARSGWRARRLLRRPALPAASRASSRPGRERTTARSAAARLVEQLAEQRKSAGRSGRPREAPGEGLEPSTFG